jgi:hypothetical protein
VFYDLEREGVVVLEHAARKVAVLLELGLEEALQWPFAAARDRMRQLAAEEQLQPRRRYDRSAAPVSAGRLGASVAARIADDLELVRRSSVVVVHFAVLESDQQGLAAPLGIVHREDNAFPPLRMEDGSAGREAYEGRKVRARTGPHRRVESVRM